MRRYNNVTDVISQILDKHTIVDMFCLKWACLRTSHLRASSSMRDCSEKSILTKQINDSIYLSNQYFCDILLLQGQ